jgi:hypothetical protein
MNSKDLTKRRMCMKAREAYRGGSRRQPHSSSSQHAALRSGLPAGAVREVLAPMDELAPGAKARGLARCDSLRRRRRRQTRASGPSFSTMASWSTRRRPIRRLLCTMVRSSSAPPAATSSAEGASVIRCKCNYNFLCSMLVLH